jgi:excisionase family DNA binding protein
VTTRLAYSPDEAAAWVGLSRRHIDREIEAGNLVARLAGSKVLVGHDDLMAWFESLPVKTKRAS